MRHTFLIVTVKKTVKIGVHLWKLSQNYFMRPDSLPRLWRYINLLLTYLLNMGITFLDHHVVFTDWDYLLVVYVIRQSPFCSCCK